VLHNNKELFEQAILRTSEAFGIEASIVEKDYFVTLFLKEISKILPAIIFKGGTSLSKCHKIIKRFSEDIDLNIECESKPTQGQRKGLKANVVSAIENLGLELANPDEIKSNMEYNKYVVDFPSVFKFDALKPHLIVETALLIRSYPTEKMQASSFIYDYFSQNGFDELIEEYALSPFETGVFFMLNIAVCDDNIYFGKRMVENIRAICAKILPERLECTVIPAFCSADEVLEYLKGNNINVIFLDIDMPGHSGFELAAILNEISPGIEIVFVSSHNDLVYSSFEYRPFCFIRKTHLDGELPDTLSKLINEYKNKNKNHKK